MSGHAIFDLDGTLVDSVAICSDILNDMLAHRGSARRMDAMSARPLVSMGGERMVAAALAGACVDPRADIVEFRSRYAARCTPHDSLFPGVRAGLKTLHDAGVTLSVCSNKPQGLCEKVLSDLGLDNLFTCVVGGRPNVPAKPHAALLELTLRTLSVRDEPCCFIGDSELDHEIARRADMPFIFVTYGYGDENWNFSDARHCDTFDAVPGQVMKALTRQRLIQPVMRVSGAR